MTAADALDLPFLQYAQQCDLRLGRQLADFVEEDRPAIGCLEPSEAALQRAGERAFLVSKQLGRDERRRNRGEVHANERSARAARALVKGARDQLFAGSRLAKYEDGSVSVRNF